MATVPSVTSISSGKPDTTMPSSSRVRKTVSSERKSNPARTSVTVRVDFPAPLVPGTSTPRPPRASPAAWRGNRPNRFTVSCRATVSNGWAATTRSEGSSLTTAIRIRPEAGSHCRTTRPTKSANS